MTQSLVRLLLDEMRDVKHEDSRLRREISKMGARQEQSEDEMRTVRAVAQASQDRLRASETRVEHLEKTVEAMTEAQRESAVQIRTLMALFGNVGTSSSQAAPSSSLASSSSSLAATGEAESTFSSSSSGISAMTITSSRPHGLNGGLMQALPFLRAYDCSSLIVSDLGYPCVHDGGSNTWRGGG